MAYDDTKKGRLFPVRDGVPTGSANERQMLEVIGGSDSFRTRIQEDAGGVKTLLRTKNGMPQFSNTNDPTLAETPDECPLADHGLVDTKYNYSGTYTEPVDGPLVKLVAPDATTLTAKRTINSQTKKEALLFNNASFFTGAMRRVMQLEHGKKQSVYNFTPGYTCTHGVFIGARSSGTPTRWLIQIDATGIYRIPISFCQNLTANWKTKEVGFIASYDFGTASRKIAPYWTATKVFASNAVKIGDAPPCYGAGHDVFYSWCGWAFNKDGTKATNVTFTYEGAHGWVKTARWMITITADGEGVPISATTLQSDGGWMVNPLTESAISGQGALQVATMPGAAVTFPFHSSHLPTSDEDCPVFSYFDTDDVEHVVRWHSTPETSDDKDVGNPLVGATTTMTWQGTSIGTSPAYVNLPSYTCDERVIQSAATKGGCGMFYSTALGHQVTNSGGNFVNIECYVDSRTGFAGGLSTYNGVGYVWTSAGFEGDGVYANAVIYTVVAEAHPIAQKTYSRTVVNDGFGALCLHGGDRMSYGISLIKNAYKSAQSTEVINKPGVAQIIATPSFNNGFDLPSGKDYKVGQYMNDRTVGTVLTFDYICGCLEVPTGLIVDANLSIIPTTVTSPADEHTVTIDSKLVVGKDIFPFASHFYGYFDGSGPLVFQAKLAGFKQDRRVRSTDVAAGSVTDNMGGYLPVNNIEAFIGVT